MPTPNPNAVDIARATEIFKLVVAMLIVGEMVLLYSLLQSIRFFLRIRKLPRPEWKRDVSGEPIQQPEPYHQVDDSVRNLGFDQLSVLQVKYDTSRNPFYIWVYRSQDAATWIEVAFGNRKPVFLQFSSFFSDGAMIATSYPTGESITTPMYISRFARHSIENAWDYHRQMLPKMRREHDDPVRVESAKDVIRFDDLSREKYQRLAYQRTYHYSVWGLLCIVLLLGLGGLGIVLFLSGSLNLNLYYVTAFAAFVVVVMMVILRRRYSNPPNAVDDLTHP